MNTIKATGISWNNEVVKNDCHKVIGGIGLTLTLEPLELYYISGCSLFRDFIGVPQSFHSVPFSYQAFFHCFIYQFWKSSFVIIEMAPQQLLLKSFT